MIGLWRYLTTQGTLYLDSCIIHLLTFHEHIIVHSIDIHLTTASSRVAFQLTLRLRTKLRRHPSSSISPRFDAECRAARRECLERCNFTKKIDEIRAETTASVTYVDNVSTDHGSGGATYHYDINYQDLHT